MVFLCTSVYPSESAPHSAGSDDDPVRGDGALAPAAFVIIVCAVLSISRPGDASRPMSSNCSPKGVSSIGWWTITAGSLAALTEDLGLY